MSCSGVETTPCRGRALRIAALGVGLSALAACLPGPSWAQYEVDWFTIASGAGQVAGNVFMLYGTIGQEDAGEMAGGNYVLGGGFWKGGAVQVVAVDENEHLEPPAQFRVEAAAPNPMFGRTVIAFDLPGARLTRVLVYDTAGRLARTLFQELLPAGRHQLVWNGTDDAGKPILAGIYFVHFNAEEFQARQKIVVLK